MVMKIKWVAIKVEGTHHEEPGSGNCTTFSSSGGSPSTVTITDSNKVTHPPIHLDQGATVEVCSDVATVKGESKTRPKGSGGKGGKRR